MHDNAGIELNRRQKRVGVALATEPTVAAAARAAECSERVIYDYLRLPHFRVYVNQQLELVLAERRRRVVTLQPKALDVMERCMDGIGVTANLQFNAAKEILNLGQNEDIAHVLQRIDALEASHADDA